MSGISFSLSIGSNTSKSNSNSKTKPSNNKPNNRSLTARSLLNDDDDQQHQQGTSNPRLKGEIRGTSSNIRINSSLLSSNVNSSKLSRQQKLKQQEAISLDSSVFEYDEVYDDMKMAEKSIKQSKSQDKVQKKAQYISGLIESAKQRQIDRVRAEDKMVQRERESEGAEFQDKGSFVTPAYLQQQEELRRAEELENLKNKQSSSSKKTKEEEQEFGMTGFYKNILDEDSKRNEAAVKAAKNRSKNRSLGLNQTLKDESDRNDGQRSTSISKVAQYDPEPESVPSEIKLAAEIGAKLGRKVDLDDEGRIVDHRQLLSGGLNLGPPKLAVGPKKPPKTGFALPIAERARLEREQALVESKKAGWAEGGGSEEEEEGLSQAEKIRRSRERQSKLLQQQLVDLESKKRKVEEESRVESAKKVARRNDDGQVEALRQKALERRKAREDARKEIDVAEL
ncbi:coiled-coil domain-containing protein 55-domain containing protein [Phakopsora pachyrhizi]|uniref:Coiled-coil domain-containing protein 55-domain containing protein n=1 Tax=Phakopsora pachyrhizi TaxID=170000 RepID=A0AAV0B2T8_PHAPC|nr:coiled-coil domain-containing protein 55-domain containing protein [Phakopsora pachyrhizi]